VMIVQSKVTQMPQNLSDQFVCPICLPKPKSSGFQ
jgi:hypothetical protein